MALCSAFFSKLAVVATTVTVTQVHLSNPTPALLPAAEWRARVDLAALYRLCDSQGLNEGINNHITAEVPDMPGHFLVFAFGLHWSEVTASNLLLVDSEVNPLASQLYVLRNCAGCALTRVKCTLA